MKRERWARGGAAETEQKNAKQGEIGFGMAFRSAPFGSVQFQGMKEGSGAGLPLASRSAALGRPRRLSGGCSSL